MLVPPNLAFLAPLTMYVLFCGWLVAPASADFAGRVYVDSNGNGVFDVGERPRALPNTKTGTGKRQVEIPSPFVTGHRLIGWTGART